MKLTRVYPGADGKITFPPNSYGQEKGVWFVRLPGCHLGRLDKHSVMEYYEDGTITVSSSILHHDFKIVNGEKVDFDVHGHLIRGEWKNC